MTTERSVKLLSVVKCLYAYACPKGADAVKWLNKLILLRIIKIINPFKLLLQCICTHIRSCTKVI